MRNLPLSKALLILLTLPVMLAAQPVDPTGDGRTGDPFGGSDGRILIDGIAATVGGEIILISEVMERAILMAQRSGTSFREPTSQELDAILGDLIIGKLLYTRAIEDSIEVGDEILGQQVDEYVGRLAAQEGSESELERIYGKSMAEIRAQVRPLVREQLSVELLRRRKFGDLKVTQRDIDEFYTEYRDSLPQVPEQVELAHIFIETEPDEQARARTFELGSSIADSLRNGGIFGEFARRYSIDPGSAAKGGELGWVPFGKFVSEYEKTVRELEINQISEPVESRYGLHVIQLLDREEDRFRSRHILIPFRPSEATIAATIDTLESLRTRIASGEDFGKLARAYSDDLDSKGRGGLIGRIAPTELGALGWVVDSLEVGESSEPRPFSLSPTQTGYHILRLVDIIPPHAVDPVEDREQIEGLALRWKQSRELAAFIDELRDEIYWEILHDFGAGG